MASNLEMYTYVVVASKQRVGESGSQGFVGVGESESRRAYDEAEVGSPSGPDLSGTQASSAGSSTCPAATPDLLAIQAIIDHMLSLDLGLVAHDART